MSDQDPKPAPIEVPAFCDRHQAMLVQRCGYSPRDPWRALIIAAQATMFQGATTSETVFRKLEGDLTRIKELGCFACRLPARFEKVINAGRSGKLTAIKELGDSWVQEAKENHAPPS